MAQHVRAVGVFVAVQEQHVKEKEINVLMAQRVLEMVAHAPAQEQHAKEMDQSVRMVPHARLQLLMSRHAILHVIYAKETHLLVLMALFVLVQKHDALAKEQYVAALKQYVVMEQFALARKVYVTEKKQSVLENMRDVLMGLYAVRKIFVKTKGVFVMHQAQSVPMVLNALVRLLFVAAREQCVPVLDQNVLMELCVREQALYV